MKLSAGHLRLAATDLTNHLACRHTTQLDLRVAQGQLAAPAWRDPDLKVLQELGTRHERAYLKFLQDEKKLAVVNLSKLDPQNEDLLVSETLRHMQEGAEVIAQGALRSADRRWFGRADVLLRVEKPGYWKWSYEVQDTKLAKDTKASAILQLLLYSELLTNAQGVEPEFLWVIPARRDFAGERYRVAEYSAYYRYVKERLLLAVDEHPQTYPEPVEHCDICRWFRECDSERRRDDHLSLVAGIRRQQRDQLVAWDVPTMAMLAGMPLPVRERPRHGSRRGIENAREQARIQVEGRNEKRLKHEPILPAVQGYGYNQLPEPSRNDVFLDFEGDPYAGDHGLQYLTGFVAKDASGTLQYEKRWALNTAEEKAAFEWLVDEITRRWHADPGMHVYHFGVHEPSTIKRLMSSHATRENEVDRLLRAEKFVDLHQSFKQGTRASVEEYSLKKIEEFYEFERKTLLEQSKAAMRYVEHRLELGWGDEEFPDAERELLEGYNREDCLSTAALRDWLESERQKLADRGEQLARPEIKSGDATEDLQRALDESERVAKQLCKNIPDDSTARSATQQAYWTLAQLLSWYRRELKRELQDKYRFAHSTDEELLDERVGLTGMNFLERVKEQKGRYVPTDRYAFVRAKNNIRKGKHLYFGEVRFGEVTDIDQENGVVTVKKTAQSAQFHPTTVFMWQSPYGVEEQHNALLRIGEWVATNPIDEPGRYRAGRDLLLRKPPRLREGERFGQFASEKSETALSRIGVALKDSVLAIQGPPGSGKTYTAARMICEFVRQGKKVGVAALSHDVIRKLLKDVVIASGEQGIEEVRCLHRQPNGEAGYRIAVAPKKNEEALTALRSNSANVVGGVSWLWSVPDAFECVDVLFIDEAGQMSLADVLAVSHAAKRLVLVGDPQQLERPTKGHHPEGTDRSALEHLLNGEKTISPDNGFFIPTSKRLHPKICAFTSEFFYEGKLSSDTDVTVNRVIQGHPWIDGAGLWFVPVEHEGNQSASPEEVDVVAKIVEGLLQAGVNWYRSTGNKRALTQNDILIVAPYNAQVADLRERLPNLRIGTVDKFQGQEAPVVIYSMTSSSADEAPHGMEFLYSPNRFNVATSRAQTAVILVGSPRLFEPECKTPRQMLLANALCGFRELATVVKPENV